MTIPPISPEERAERLWMDLETDDPTSLDMIERAIKAAENAAYMKAADALFKAEGLNAVDLFIARDVIRSLRHKDTP